MRYAVSGLLSQATEEWGPPGLFAVGSVGPGSLPTMPLFVSLAGTKRSSLIIAVVWGKLTPADVKQSKKQVSRVHPPKQLTYSEDLNSTLLSS